eukprot:2652721-Lingulodinium_polyedra.AAC.1
MLYQSDLYPSGDQRAFPPWAIEGARARATHGAASAAGGASPELTACFTGGRGWQPANSATPESAS